MTDENLPPWARMSLGYDGDPKVASLARFGGDAGLCRDLHLAMIRYCRRNSTDGWVPLWEPARLAWPLPPDHTAELVEHLAEVELIVPADADSMAPAIAPAKAPAKALAIAPAMAPAIAPAIAPAMGGWLVVNYAKWQETAAEIEAYSKAQAERGRRGAAKRWSDGVPVAGAMAPAIAPATETDGTRHSARDGDRMAEREREREIEAAAGSVRNGGAGASPAGAHPAAADHFELDGQIIAILHGQGRTIDRADAAAIRRGLLAGKSPRDPGRYVLGIVRKDTAAAMACLPNSTASRQPPRVQAIHARCGGQHEPGRCPVDDDPARDRPDPLPYHPPRPADDVATHGAASARKLLAEAQAPADPQPEPEAQHAERDQAVHDTVAALQPDDDGIPF